MGSSRSRNTPHHPQHTLRQLHGEGAPNLKYLGFFHVALTSASLYLSSFYEAAKDQAGPLKPGVEDVEAMLKIVLGPVIKIVGNNSCKLLDFVDKKVDEKLKFVDKHMPRFIKPVTDHVLKALSSGPKGETCSTCGVKCSATRGFCTSLMTVLMVSISPALVKIVAHHVLHSAELVNNVTGSLRKKHFPFSEYLPVIPVKDIEKATKMTADPRHTCNLCESEVVC